MVFIKSVAHNLIPLVGYTVFISIALTLLCGAPRPVGAMPLTGASTMRSMDRIYCSTSLADAINVICGGRFNTYSLRFPSSAGSRSLKAVALKSFAPGDNVFYRPLQAGPINECCARPCGYSDLKMYCAPDP